MRPFTPPTPDQVRAHLNRFTPQPPSRTATWVALIALPLLLIVMFGSNDPGLVLLPLLLLLGLVVAANVRVRRLAAVEKATLHVQELAMRRRHIESLRKGWELLPRVVHHPALHGRVVASIAHNLDQLRGYDAAIVAYDYLIDRLVPDDPAAVQFQVLRSLAQLSAERLTDADDTLRRLRGVIGRYQNTPVGAAYRLAQLLQQVRTHHYQQAIDESDTLVDALRPLGVQAGYGHALMALAHQQLAKHTQQVAPDDVQRWWYRATLLLPIEALTHRYPELRALSNGSTGS